MVAQLGEDALVRTRLRGDPMVRLEPVAVGVEVDQGSEVLGFLGHRVLLLEAWDRRDALRRPKSWIRTLSCRAGHGSAPSVSDERRAAAESMLARDG